MVVITKDEMEELTTHFSSRSDIWLSHNGVWLRQIENEAYALGVVLRNSLPEGLCALTSKPLSWSQKTVDDYVLWLLDKYTAYSMRMKVRGVLLRYKIHSSHIDALSRDLCELQGGPFLHKFERVARTTVKGDQDV